MSALLFIWMALLAVLLAFAIGRRREGGALTLGYFLALSLIHVPGVLPYLNTRSVMGRTQLTEIGFQMTLIGMAAFIAGAIVARIAEKRDQTLETPPSRSQALDMDRMGWKVLIMGASAYFVVIPVVSFIPSLTSVFASVAALVVLGLWLQLYGADALNDRRRMLRAAALIPLLPLSTLVSAGFIGYGTVWAVSVVAFLFILSRRRLILCMAAPVVIFVGLSLFVTYMGQREGLRDLIWYQRAPLLTRLERTSELVTEFQLLDLNSPQHRFALDERLNQNYLVGAGVKRYQDGLNELTYGGTVPWWAVIPRAVWPDKPAVGGGGNLVSNFTAIRFKEGTSVGVGQVLEFFMNFGTVGVLVGFFGLGFLLRRLDRSIMLALARNDLVGILRPAMPGLMLLQPGGNLLEIVVGVASAAVAAHLLISFKVFDRTKTAAPETDSIRVPTLASVTFRK